MWIVFQQNLPTIAEVATAKNPQDNLIFFEFSETTAYPKRDVNSSCILRGPFINEISDDAPCMVRVEST